MTVKNWEQARVQRQFLMNLALANGEGRLPTVSEIIEDKFLVSEKRRGDRYAQVRWLITQGYITNHSTHPRRYALRLTDKGRAVLRGEILRHEV